MGINNSLLKSIQTIIDKAIEIAPFDKTRQAQVITNNNDGTYTIRLDGILYNNIPSYPKINSTPVGSIVKVVMPGNQHSQMFIWLVDTNVVDMTNPMLNLDKYQVVGDVDKDIYDALVALGWDSDVIV